MTLGRRSLLAGTVGLALAGAGCSQDATGEAQRMADELFPGQLRVLSARTEFGGGPIPGWVTRATYAVNDDPDAYVTVVSLSEPSLRRAVDVGRWAAEDFRLLDRSLAAEGIRLAARSAATEKKRGGIVQVELAITEQTRRDAVAGLDRALTAWHRASEATSQVDLVQLKVVDPGAGDRAPTADRKLPRLATMTLPARLDALARSQRFTASVSSSENPGRLTVRSSLMPVLSEEQTGAAVAAVRAAADEWLRTTGQPGVVVEPNLVWSFLLANNLTTIRSYAMICPEARPVCGVNAADLILLGCTVDLVSMTVTEVTRIEPRRHSRGGMVLPIEPGRVPA